MDTEDFTPEEDDAYISDAGRNGYSVSMCGKARGWIPDMESAVMHLCAEMCKQRYYPNVWYINDHGNITLLSVNAETNDYEFTDTAYV